MVSTKAIDNPLDVAEGGVAAQSRRNSLSRSAIAQRLLGLPILYKVLVANAAIVMFGAVVGTWMTIEMVRRAPHGTYYGLAILFVVAGIVLSVIVNFLVLRAAFQPLAVLDRAALAVKNGDLSARAAEVTFTDPQIAHLAETFNATLDELARDRLELRSLASQVVRAQEEERKRISRELHDDTAQILFAQVLRLTALKSSADPTMQETAAELESMTVEALEGVRRLALELRPPALDDLGLLDAWRSCAAIQRPDRHPRRVPSAGPSQSNAGRNGTRAVSHCPRSIDECGETCAS